MSLNSRVPRRAMAALFVLCTAPIGAQRPEGAAADSVSLTLATAQDLGLRSSRTVSVVREAAAAAAARARQAAVFPNPVLSYARENTSAGAARNAQGIIAFEQPIEPGLRAARRRAASLRAEAATALLRRSEDEVLHDVARAFARVMEADRRARLATDAAAVFERAQRVSDARFAAGDISGYAQGRIHLETARYRALRAEAGLERRRARLALAELLVVGDAPMAPDAFRLDTIDVATSGLHSMESAESLVALALRRRPDLSAARLEAESRTADAHLAARERIPTASVRAGMKTEEGSALGTLRGFVLGVALPLPLWDRRTSAVQAADADAREALALARLLERRVELEVREALSALDALEDQLAALTPALGALASATVRAAEAAYTEGEIPLVEWLDAVRARQEAEASLAALRAESIIRRSALDRAIGLSSRRSIP